MRICHIITRLIVGGAQENTILTCRGLVERGHEVVLMAGPETGPEGSLWDEAGRAGCELIHIDAMRRAVRPRRDRRAMITIADSLRKFRPDVVHTHSSKAGILGRMAAARTGVPVVVHTIHGMSFNRTQPVVARAVFRALERRAARYTTAFISVADAMTDQAVSAGLGPRERFTTIYSGMDTDRYRPDPAIRQVVRSEWGVGENDVVVGTIARLFSNKGYEEIISAMPAMVKGCPRVRFVWIGDGANRSQYEMRLSQCRFLNRVNILGLVPPQRVAELVNGFDVVLHASRWEGLPRAVVQGLLTEVPAVSFDNDGAPEVVVPDQTGILVPYGDTRRLAKAVAKLAADPALRRRLGRVGRTRCLSRFDWRVMVDEIEALYERLRPGAAD